jgi:hypothetical protein
MNDIRYTSKIGPLGVKFSWRSSKGWGRFGGGWQWKIGVQAAGRTVLFSLLFCELILTWGKQ